MDHAIEALEHRGDAQVLLEAHAQSDHHIANEERCGKAVSRGVADGDGRFGRECRLAAARGETLASPLAEVFRRNFRELVLGTAAYAAHQAEWQSRRYPFHYLPHLLGDSGASPEVKRHSSVLFLRSGSNAIALHVDEIRNQADLPIEKISAALAMMELKGMVRQVGGMRWFGGRVPDSQEQFPSMAIDPASA